MSERPLNETPQQFIRRLLEIAEAPAGPKMTVVKCPCGIDYLMPGFTACPECGAAPPRREEC